LTEDPTGAGEGSCRNMEPVLATIPIQWPTFEKREEQERRELHTYRTGRPENQTPEPLQDSQRQGRTPELQEPSIICTGTYEHIHTNMRKNFKICVDICSHMLYNVIEGKERA